MTDASRMCCISALVSALIAVPGLVRAQGVVTPGGTGAGGPPALLVPQGSPLDRSRAPSLPPTAPGLAPETPPPAATFAPGVSARIVTAGVIGASVYPQAEMSAITAGLTGPSVPFSRVEEVRQGLLARYRADGYLLTTVSSALDRNGNLRINVVEGYIADVKLQGDIGAAGTQVLRFLNRLLEERPIRIKTLERYLLLATDLPGVTVRSVLRPSADDPAAVTLIAQVSRKSYDGVYAADNRSFKQTGPEQMLAVAGFNSFSQYGERTELSILHSFNNTQTFGQAATEFFVGSSGLKVRVYGGIGGVNPSGSLRVLGYDGRTRVFGVQGSYPVIRSREQSLFAVMAVDAIESDIHTDTGPLNLATRASFDSLRILRGGFDYTLQDNLLGGDRTGVNTASLRLSRGLNSLGATQPHDPQAGRSGERTDFFKANMEITRTQTLYRPFDDASIALYGLVAGQVSASVLPPAEKFFLGGIRYNRGFYSGEVTGDNALTASVELQFNSLIPVTGGGTSIMVGSQFYGFYDWGETWELQRSDPNHVVRSAGGGWRGQITQYVSTEVEGVHRFTRSPEGTSATVKPLKADAAYWRVVLRF